MGYYVSVIDATANITIPVDRVPDALAAFRKYEETKGHISWCHHVADYEKYGLEPVEVVKAMLCDFGFESSSDETHITIDGWAGDKMGSAWNDVWDIIGSLADNEATWFICGEDQHMWFEEVDGKGARKTGYVRLVKATE